MFVASRTVTHLIRNGIAKPAVRYRQSFAKKRRVVDPGIQNRKSLVNEREEFEQLNDYDFDLEADFMNVATTHKQHEYQQNLLQEKENYLIVKQKYFKEKLPNFLTWTDKEQIRYLHNTNPEEWTVEKLSEGFPALPEVIVKIVKSTWTKTSENKIRNHDESVKRNWGLFKEQKLNDLPPNVVDHLKKFTNRDLNASTFEMPEEFKSKDVKSMVVSNIKVGSEFSDIIRSYERLKNKKDASKVSTVDKHKLQKPPKKDTYLLNSFNSKQYSKHTTLDHLQQQIQEKAQDGLASVDEELLVKVIKQEFVEEQCDDHLGEAKALQPATVIDNALGNKYTNNNEISARVKKFNEKALDYPNRIVIPKDKFKRGYTYKLNDCYYDDDGEFLYRVPGMYK